VLLEGAERFQQWFLTVPAECWDWFRLLGLFGEAGPPVRQIGLQRSITRRFSQLARDLRQASERDLPWLAARMQLFMVELLRWPEPSLADAEHGDWSDAACRLLATDLAGQRPLPQVAAELGLSYSTFRQGFRQRMGISPSAYRIRCRIEQAQVRLLESDASLGSIAEQLGYSDVYAFSRQFRAVTGQSPGRWRQLWA
jgi:AraC-like DNA-binding protein